MDVGSRLVRLSPGLLPARSRRYVVAPHARIPSLLSSHGRDTQIIDDPATGVGTLINKSLEATIIVHPRDRVEKGICSPGKLQPSVFGAHVLEPGTGRDGDVDPVITIYPHEPKHL